MGAVTGQLPVPLSAFFSPSSPPPAYPLPPYAGKRALLRRGRDEEIKRKLDKVLLFDKTGEVGSQKLQTTFEKTGSGQREKGWTRVRQTDRGREKDRKSHLGFEVMVDEERETEREVH